MQMLSDKTHHLAGHMATAEPQHGTWTFILYPRFPAHFTAEERDSYFIAEETEAQEGRQSAKSPTVTAGLCGLSRV